MMIAIKAMENIGVRSLGSLFLATLIAPPSPGEVCPVMISAMISVLKERAKLLSTPKPIYGRARGILIFVSVEKNVAESTLVAHLISNGMALMPETKASYKIGKASKNTIQIGALEVPESTKNKKTNAAVGALLKIRIIGLKKR